MLNNFLPFLYGVLVIVLLILAGKIMLNGFVSGQSSQTQNTFSNKKRDDRTGLITIHPELLNKDGYITDEDLLTVRFSKDTDHPQSFEKPSE